MTIMAVAAMMLLSYSFLAIPSSETDASPGQDTGVEYFGYGGSLNAGQLYEFVAEDFGDDLIIPGMGQIDIEDALEMLLGDDDYEDLLEDGRMNLFIKSILMGKGYRNITTATMDASGDVYILYSIDDDVISVSTAVKGEVSLDIDASGYNDTRLIVDDGRLSILSYRNIEVSLDDRGDLRSVYTTTSTMLKVDSYSNLVYDGGITVDKSERTIDIDTAFRTDSSIEFTEPVDLSAIKTRSKAVEAVVTIEQGMTSNTPGFRDVIVNTSVPMTLRIMFDEDEFEMENISHDLQSLKIQSMLPDLEFDHEDLPGRIMRIDSDKASQIEKKIDSLRKQAYDAMDDLKVTVTFTGADGSTLVTRQVGYGDTIPFVSYGGDVPSGMVFVDWVPADAVGLKNTYIAMGDIMMTPMFALEITGQYGVGDIALALGTGSNVLMTVPINSDMVIPLTGVDEDSALIIDVVDGDRKVARWTIVGDTAGCASSISIRVSQSDLVPETMDGVNPIRLSFEASGKMPAGTVVSYNVAGIYGDGVTVEVFHVESDGRNVLVGRSLVDDGFVDIPAHHFSDYILQGYLGSDSGNGGSNTLLIAGGAIAVAIVLIGAFVYFRRS